MTRPRSAPLGTGSHSYSTASTSSYLGAQLLMRLETSAAEKIGGHSALARRQSTILSTEHQDLDVLHFIKNTHTGPPLYFKRLEWRIFNCICYAYFLGDTFRDL